MPLTGREGGKRPRPAEHRLSGVALDLDLTLDDDNPGPLRHLVVAELLTGLDADQHGTRLARVEDNRRDGASGSVDRGQIPGLHGRRAYRASLDSNAVSLAVEQLSLGPARTNCYVVRLERGSPECVVIDPSGDPADLRLRLAAMAASCSAILVTHGHWDHLVGVAGLAEGSGAPVHMPAGERQLLEEPAAFWGSAPVAIRAHVPEVLLDGGETVTAAGIDFEVLSVPGHSPAHLAYHADGCLFSGDVLFAGSVGRVDIPGADWDTLVTSIRTLVERLPPETIVYSGHGPVTTLGAELARNPFLAELRTP